MRRTRREDGGGGFRKEEGSFDVSLNVFIEEIFIRIREGLAAHDTSIKNKYVEFSKSFYAFVQQMLTTDRCGYIGLYSNCSPAFLESFDFVDDLFCCFGIADICIVGISFRPQVYRIERTINNHICAFRG